MSSKTSLAPEARTEEKHEEEKEYLSPPPAEQDSEDFVSYYEEDEEEGEEKREQEEDMTLLAIKHWLYNTILVVLGNRFLLVLIAISLFIWWLYDMFAWWEHLDGYWSSAIFAFATIELIILQLLIFLSKDRYRYYRETGIALLMQAMANEQDVIHSQNETLVSLVQSTQLLIEGMRHQEEQLDRIEELTRIRRRRRRHHHQDDDSSVEEVE